MLAILHQHFLTEIVDALKSSQTILSNITLLKVILQSDVENTFLEGINTSAEQGGDLHDPYES